MNTFSKLTYGHNALVHGYLLMFSTFTVLAKLNDDFGIVPSRWLWMM